MDTSTRKSLNKKFWQIIDASWGDELDEFIRQMKKLCEFWEDDGA